LNEAQRVADPVVVVGVEPDLVDVEGLCAVDVCHRDCDEFDLPVHARSLSARTQGAHMHKRLVTRYASSSTEAADENQRRVEGVFAELEANKPGNVSYIVLRLEDGSFVHVSFHDHGDDEVNPISSTAAFAHFQDGHGERREGGVDQQKATLVGSYITKIE
jgi:predicted SnoaL-like aldol condensation-catalyzing enzyme